MKRRNRLIIAISVLAAAASALGLWAAHRVKVKHGHTGLPTAYSARVVRTTETETSRLVTESRVARMNNLVREDWTELNERRGLIWRPDLGKVFLLVPEHRSYSESVMFSPASTDSILVGGLDPAAIDRDLSVTVPAGVDTVVMEDRTIDGHPCEVSERRLVFASGHVEVTRTFRARDLGGLPLRIEIFSRGPSELPKVTIELRDLSTDVKSADFEVPAGYAKTASTGIGAPPSGASWR